MKHVTNFSKLSEVALACVVDLCRAAAYIDPEAGDVPLRIVAGDIAHDIKARTIVILVHETSSYPFRLLPLSTASVIKWWIPPETLLGIVR